MKLEQPATAFLFPGQGSQYMGMGKQLCAAYPVARQTFEETDDILEFKLSTLCFDGPVERLNDTANTQPALYTAGIAAMRTLYEAWESPFSPAYAAGHSLGELTALTAAGALAFPDGLRLVRRRGELMRDADQHSPGGMTAVLALDLDVVSQLCQEASEETGGVVVVANDNCPGQVVIAGDEAALAAAMVKAEEAGARRVIRLPVSIAAHSPLMERAAADFREALDKTPFHQPLIPIIGNTTAQPLTTVEDIRAELAAQLTHSVLWTDSVNAMIDAGITTFVELGSKDVLSGLVKRIDRSTTRYIVETPEQIEMFSD